MRSRLIIFATLILAIALCSTSVAGNLKASQGSFSKSGQLVEGVAPVASEVSTLPTVGTRTGRGLDEIIISEDFEAYDFGTLPPGWTQVDVDGGSTPVPNADGMSTWQVFGGQGWPAHGGTKSVANFYNSPATINDDWLILPQQNLGGTITLSYWASSQDPLYLESYEVRVSTTGNQPADFTNLVADVNEVPNPWAEHTHDLTAYAGAPFWIAFHYNSFDEFVFKIDDLILEGEQLGEFGTLTGTVRNEDNNNPVSGATVEIVGTAFSATTNAQGQFSIGSVPANTYDVNVSHPLYQDEDVSDVVITTGQATDIQVLLEPLALEFHDFQTTADSVFIADVDSAYMSLNVAGDYLISDLDITINLHHTYDSDLTIWLESPWDQRVLLADGVGGQFNNFIDTRFDDEAATPIGSGSAPFTGSYRPEGVLSDFDAFSSQGEWTLVVYDAFPADTGWIVDFTLHVTSPLDADDQQSPVPAAFSFEGNYPNPFNASTQFRFDMARAGHASLVLYNITGQEVARLIDGSMEVGHHAVYFNANNLPSGLYFARFDAPEFTATTKVILLK